MGLRDRLLPRGMTGVWGGRGRDILLEFNIPLVGTYCHSIFGELGVETLTELGLVCTTKFSFVNYLISIYHCV